MSFLDNIRRRSRDRPRRIVFPEGEDSRTLQAVREIQDEGLLAPVLLGDADRIRDELADVGGDPGAIEVVDPRGAGGTGRYVEALLDLRRSRGMMEQEAREWVRNPLMRAAMMVRFGEVDGSVAGTAHAASEVLRAALWCVGPADGIRTVSAAYYMVVQPFRTTDPEVLTFTDVAVVPDPTGEELARIGAAAAAARRTVVGDSPTVAFLSYSTQGSAEGPSVDRVRAALTLFRDMAPGVPADGELQVDAALLDTVARRKTRYSAAGGNANVLVFPNLDAGDIGAKLVERLGGAEAVGPIVQGLHRPCNQVSRGATAADIVNVACVTSIMTA